ncbi:GNAT family N-acetyltransferase [Sphingobacteriaceae bacterium]|nr:GNAT family N-acetyltransferase [Sphingobacteriaceae bacterium]
MFKKNMEVKHDKRENSGIFYVENNGERIANLLYIFKDETVFSIEHTVVNPENEGKGIARKLVEAAVDFARKNNYKIIPACPYAKKVLEGSELYKDILF